MTQMHPPPLPNDNPQPIALRRRSIGQILLDPRSIQWMLGSGGALLVAGMVVWLASLGVFDDPGIVALTLGSGTLLMLGAGWWVIRATPLQLAGRAVTLLACLIMPLNLWFHHANGLLTLEGNLWMAAVVCCVLYAMSAMVLRDPLFVYVLMSGIAGTGLLILADMGKFAEIAAPSLMLSILGLLAIHIERAFPTSDSPFSRNRFGRAFFRSGHALLGGALLLLMGAQIAGWILPSRALGHEIVRAAITTEAPLKLLALGIVLAGTYAYGYSHIVVRRARGFVTLAGFCLIWAQLLGMQMLDLTYPTETVIGVTALIGLLLLVASRWMHATKSAGNGLMLLAYLCTTFMALSRLLVDRTHPSLAVLLGVVSLLTFAAAAIVGRSSWRRGHMLMGFTSGVLSIVVLGVLSDLTLWQKWELISVLGGVTLLVAGHVGWYREQVKPSDTVTLHLTLGALLAGVPILIAAVVSRVGGSISMIDEMALLTISGIMLVSGLMLQLRSTTLTGGTLLSLHIAMLLGFAGWEVQLALGVYLAIAGGGLFLVGLALAIYRERLLELPEKIHRREGVFKVLSWR